MKNPLLPASLLLLGVLASACASSSRVATTGRLHHVGLVWLNDPGNEADRQRLIDAAHTFLREIPEVREMSVGATLPSESALVDSSFDLCFVMEFDDRAALDRYARHPVHVEAAEQAFLPLASRILFYDFVSE